MRYVAGRVELDEHASSRSGTTRAMNRFRFKDVSIVPQYAMSALNPTRKVGAVAADLLASRGVDYGTMLPELKRRLELVGLSADVLGMFPIELSGGMKQRGGDGDLDAARPVAPDRRRGHVGARRLEPARARRDAASSSATAAS